MAPSEIQLPSRCDSNLISNIASKEGFKDYQVQCESATAKGDNFLGELFRIEIKEKNSSKKLKLMVKVCPDDPFVLETFPVRDFYYREVKAYSTVLPALYNLQDELDLDTTEKFYFAKLFPSPTGTVVLEDLGVKGFTMYDKYQSFDMEHAKVVVKKMAYLHALSFVMKERKPEVLESLTEYACDGHGFGPNVERVTPQVSAVVGNVKDEDLRNRLIKFLDNFVGKLDIFLDKEAGHPYNVFCHGDSWTNNMLFTHEGGKPKDLIFIDFQILRYCSPITDLSYMIYNSTDKAFREAHLTDLLDYYYSCLSNRIALFEYNPNKLYPKEVFEKQQKALWNYGFFLSLVVLPLILSDKDNVPEIGDILAREPTDPEFILSDRASKRLNEIIEEFAEKNEF